MDRPPHSSQKCVGSRTGPVGQHRKFSVGSPKILRASMSMGSCYKKYLTSSDRKSLRNAHLLPLHNHSWLQYFMLVHIRRTLLSRDNWSWGRSSWSWRICRIAMSILCCSNRRHLLILRWRITWGSIG